MEPLVQEPTAQPQEARPERLEGAQEPSVRHLLDVVVSILAAEYVQTARQHPDEFSQNGGTA